MSPQYTGPGMHEYWGEVYWVEVKRGGRPGHALTYGPGPHSYRPPGHAYTLPWKGRGGGKPGGVIKRRLRRGKGRRARDMKEAGWVFGMSHVGLVESTGTPPCPELLRT